MRIVYLGEMPRDTEANWSEECQGLTHDSDTWFVAQRNTIWRTPVGRRLNQDIAGPSVGIPSARRREGFDHIGDIDHFEGRLFVPLENNAEPRLPGHVGVFAAADLTFLGSAALDETSVPWCAVNPADGLLYTSTFNPRSLHRYTVDASGPGVAAVRVASVPLLDEQGDPLKLYHVQGGAFTADGVYVVLATDHEDGTGAAKGFSIFAAETGRRLAHRSVSYDPIDFGGEIEGVDVWSLVDPNDGRANALIHLLVLNNDTFDSDNIVIKNWRVIFDDPAEQPQPPSPQGACDALRARYDALRDLLGDTSDVVEAKTIRATIDQVLREMKRRGCAIP